MEEIRGGIYVTAWRYQRIPDPKEASKPIEEEFLPFISSLCCFAEPSVRYNPEGRRALTLKISI